MTNAFLRGTLAWRKKRRIITMLRTSKQANEHQLLVLSFLLKMFYGRKTKHHHHKNRYIKFEGRKKTWILFLRVFLFKIEGMETLFFSLLFLKRFLTLVPSINKVLIYLRSGPRGLFLCKFYTAFA